MNSAVKKTVIYSLVGILQFGTGASVLEAAALYQNNTPPLYAMSKGHHQPNEKDRREAERRREMEKRREQERRERDQRERRRQHDERRRQENERHEREMRRRQHESEREWRARQEREKKRHDRALRDIAALLIGIAIGSSGK
ncbi:hypothetical protein [Acetonema longum]|uniref:Uncharacterized protein n=1 Tax=Acetonema longum DSM 6540 TaxID=1009370 RepID=F7NES1_9FIRM|nr:hypothetical protein [Acetonema longum]EGO65482.1 hypothetical protein ALO_02681 [Acetonema longum DSM 6540]